MGQVGQRGVLERADQWARALSGVRRGRMGWLWSGRAGLAAQEGVGRCAVCWAGVRRARERKKERVV